MSAATPVPYSFPAGPIRYEVLKNGRLLVLKDALFNPLTQKYHSIHLEKFPRKFFGFEIGKGGLFTGITEEVAREIQKTYGVFLKTLNSHPNGAAFWGDASKTQYIKKEEAAESMKRGRLWGAKTSYPLGAKKNDLFLAKEDAALYGKEKMTLHDAIQTGIWNSLSGGVSPPPAPVEKNLEGKKSPPEALLGVARPSREKTRKGRGDPGPLPSEPREKASRNKKETRKIDPENASEKSGRSKQPKRKVSGEDPITRDLEEMDREIEELSNESDSPSASQERRTKRGRKKKPSQPEERTLSAPKEEPLEGEPVQSSKDQSDTPIATYPSIPAYSAKSTPFVAGYDDAPFEERRRRMIEHLDKSSPVPFSAFVDHNQEKRIDDALFRRMLDGLRRLALNPKASDPDASYMKKLMKNWFRAAYHYLDKNSKPGDGYQQILNKVYIDTSNPHKAEKKAKEIYWRKHATIFWMTLVDLFSADLIDIDPLHKDLSNQTSLNSLF